MDGFRQVISDCALCDMGYQGNRSTVEKKKIWWALTLTLTLIRHLHHSQWNKLTLLQHKGREGGKGRGNNLLYCIFLPHSYLQLTND